MNLIFGDEVILLILINQRKQKYVKGTRYCYDNLIDGYFMNLFETGLVCNNKQKNENGSIMRVEEKPVVLYKELINR